jgi:hypothetical protein
VIEFSTWGGDIPLLRLESAYGKNVILKHKLYKLLMIQEWIYGTVTFTTKEPANAKCQNAALNNAVNKKQQHAFVLHTILSILLVFPSGLKQQTLTEHTKEKPTSTKPSSS